MMRSFPIKSEQIEAILHDMAYDLTLKYAGRDESGVPQYSKTFNVTRKEIEEYVKKHYTLDNLPFAHSFHDLKDGLYIIRVSKEYQLYYQERGIRSLEQHVSSEDDVWKYYINYMLNTSRTGLEWK
jgi:hypothetical protein